MSNERDELFKMLVLPHTVYEIDWTDHEDIKLIERVLLAFNIAEGATGYSCLCKGVGIGDHFHKFRCSSDMLYLTPQEAKLHIIEELRSGIQARLDEQVSAAQRLTNLNRALRRFEQELEAGQYPT